MYDVRSNDYSKRNPEHWLTFLKLDDDDEDNKKMRHKKFLPLLFDRKRATELKIKRTFQPSLQSDWQ